MRLRSNPCLLLLCLSPAAPLVSSLTSKIWDSSATCTSSSPGRSRTGGGVARYPYPVPRRGDDSCCRAAINASVFASRSRGKHYEENRRRIDSSSSEHASRRLRYLNYISKALRRRAVSTRTPSSLCANTGGNVPTGTVGVDATFGAENKKDKYASDEKCPPKVDSIDHPKQEDEAAPKDDASKSKMKFRTFEEMLELYRDTPILVSFEAKWCGPCKLMKKELKIVRDELAESVMVARVDTEKFPSLGARYEVEGLPSVILFVDGEPVHRIEGIEEASEILRQVRDFLR